MIWLRKFATEHARREVAKLKGQVDQLKADLEVAGRALAVVEAERDELAAVVARNLVRVQAESAAAARARAQHEGNEP